MNLKTRNHATNARLLGALVAFLLAARMVTGGLWILTPASVTGKIAALSAYPAVMAYAWMALAVCCLPYMISQVFNCWQRHYKKIIYVTVRVVMAGGVIWGYLAFSSRGLDYKYVTEIFVMDTLACMAMAAVLGNSRNSEQARVQDGAA